MFKEAINRFKLSPQQEHLWLMQQASTAMPAYAQCVISIEGTLDPKALNLALREVVSRHEILRTVFESSREMILPLQVITDESGGIEEKIELTGLSEDRREARVGAELRKMEEDLRWRTGLRSKLIALGPVQHLLLVSLPALCSDGASLKNLVKKICGSYASILQRAPLLDEPLQYSVISEWLNGLLESEQAAAGIEYWRKLDLTPSTLGQLPYRSRSLNSSEMEPQVASGTIPHDSLQKIEKFAEKYDVSLSEFLLACWQVLLWRLTGQERITVGVAYDGRTDTDLEQALGLLTKYLPIQMRFNEEMRFDHALMQLVKSARQADNWQECFAWRHIPDPAERHQPLLFPFGFEFEEWPRGISLGDVEFSLRQKLVRLDRPVVKLGCVHRQDRLVTEFFYNARLLSEKQVTRIASEFLVLIDNLLDAPGRRIAEVDIVSDAEKESLLRLNATEVDLAPDYIHRRFERQVKDTPDSTALISESRHLTYAELNARSNRLAHHLRKLGVKPGAIVAICADRSIEMVIGLLGILKSGGAYLPLDPDYPESRLTFMLEDSQASLLLSQPGLVRGLSEGNARIIYLDESIIASAPESEENPSCAVTTDSLAYLLYTSGSTGKPKGVAVTHRSLLNLLLSMRRRPGLSSTDVLLAVTTISFDIAGAELFLPLITGARVALASAQTAADGLLLAERLRRGDITVMQATPSTWRMLLAADWGGVPHLTILCGGEGLPLDLAAALISRCKALWNLYGPTETTIWSTAHDAGAAIRERKEPSPIVSIGRPIDNTQIYLLDSLRQPVPIGIPGELYIGGAGLARGYWNQSELTAEKFAPDPFTLQAGRRMYRTGDLARWREDEELEFIVRTDDQVKIRGYRIELGEIEAALNSHTQVKQSAVIIREDKKGDKQLAGYVVGAERTSPAELKRHLRKRLPEYMVPEAILVLKEMPVTVNGKIDRKKLPSIDDAGRQIEQGYVRARTPVEEMVVDVFEGVLNRSPIGICDNFFEVGGHSLLATQVVSRIRNIFGVEIGVESIFSERTAEGLARMIDGAMRAGNRVGAPPPGRISREGLGAKRLPLSFAQQRLWFIDQFGRDRAAYNIPGAVRLEGRFHLEVLERTINEIIRRHEILRTRIEVEESSSIQGPVQVIEEWEPRKLEVMDLTGLPREEREEAARRNAREEAGAVFDLSRGPLLRVKLLKLAENDHILLYTLHHIVSDGWSMGVLAREIGEIYRAYDAGAEPSLEALPIQYGDFAVWQKRWLTGEALEKQTDYWKKQLAGVPITTIPADHSRIAATSTNAQQQSAFFTRDLSESLKELSRKEGATLFMTLLAAFQVLLRHYTRQDDIVVGTDVANRNRFEIEPLIGFFVNLLVMRTDLSRNPSFMETLKRVRDVTLDAYTHQDVPFDKLVEVLRQGRNPNYSPLFQVKIVLQNAPSHKLELPGLTLRPLDPEYGPAKNDLLLNMTETDHGLRATLMYNTALYEVTTIERILRNFELILRIAVEQPGICLKDIDERLAAAEAERQLLMQEEIKAARRKMLRERIIRPESYKNA